MNWDLVGGTIFLGGLATTTIGVTYFDRRRIARFVEPLGWKLLNMSGWSRDPRLYLPWVSLTPTRIGRLYEIDVTDAHGAVKTLRCSTTARYGTWFVDDRNNPLPIDEIEP